MKTFPNPNDFVDFQTLKKLNACARRAASHEHENTLMPQPAIAAIQRLLKVGKTIKPILDFLTSFPLVPVAVRTGIGALVQAFQSAAVAGPELAAQFKAGKDLEPIA